MNGQQTTQDPELAELVGIVLIYFQRTEPAPGPSKSDVQPVSHRRSYKHIQALHHPGINIANSFITQTLHVWNV